MKSEDHREHLTEAEQEQAKRKAREEIRRLHEARLDEGVEETFPASDPVAVKHIS
ncbi:MAG: hypothetical protein WA840_20805 [Caulobacteraceae bacterium]